MKLSTVKTIPSPQNQIDIFDWHYKLPLKDVNSGSWDEFFHKPHWIDRCEHFFGELKGLRSLEIGPNEGEVTYHLFNHGIRDLTSIEARSANFLKCLIVNNIFRMESVRLMCGDALLHLKENIYEMCYCAGVFYHAKDPLDFLQSLSKGCKRMVMVTHYYHEQCKAYDKRNEDEQKELQVNWDMDTGNTETFSISGKHFRKIKHFYKAGPSHDMYGHGGIENYAYMMPLKDPVVALEFLGWKVLGVDDYPSNPRGSWACIYAENPI
jgi:hypothetical protein